ncbi:helix-turn-helix transcriptional regulator [Chitinophaga agrisoli]|uniref:Helix-turn-helix transcriptional regulator n=1 Tax=Chitinophaga agrisoli TaxID=2607653 RepID=A0A5B2W0B5_9BACT|nr:AraC family transcriptional regulator [Chitinophaga agrisoli]KAA2245101.1 helix-turn-helix transcriptional regulator [Chitinophaga agrisoli]
MSAQHVNGQIPHILYSCYSRKSSEGEQFISEHIFGYTISGSSETYLGNKAYTFNEGDFRFIRKNQLTRYTKFPPPGGEYRAISIKMDQDTLRSLSEEFNLHMDGPFQGENALHLAPHKLLRHYIDSLTPYLNTTGELSIALTNQKVREAVMLLLETNPSLKNVLFDFSEPGKIDLEAYMNEHYKFNVHLDRFAYLTGRSLATFKRDFEKIFHTTPSRWLQQRRLKEAYYLLKEKGRRTSDVYLEVGFEDLSHFSYAFKKTFGVTPSAVSAIG